MARSTFANDGRGPRAPSRPAARRRRTGGSTAALRRAGRHPSATPSSRHRGSFEGDDNDMTAIATQEIPLVDLRAQYATIRDEVRKAIDEVLDSMQLTIGPNVKAFDQEFASYIGTKHAIGVGSGTDALQLAIRACGVSSGDEVITVSHTFFATVEAILYANARPILVEIEERSMLIDPAAVAAAITPRTKAIIPVHLYGRGVDMKPLRQIAQDRNITIIEDAAQAHGALLDDGQKAGAAGRVNCFSFYCSKNLGAYGEAGSITTNDDRLADELRALREHGQSTRYYHPVIEKVAGEVLSIPMFPELTDVQVDRVATAIREFMKAH